MWTAELARWDREAVQRAALAAARVALDALVEDDEVEERDDLSAQLDAAEAELGWPRPRAVLHPVARWAPGPRDFVERIARRWSVRASVRAAMVACLSLRNTPVEVLAASVHAGHAHAVLGPAVTEPGDVAARAAEAGAMVRARVARAVAAWLLAGPRAADPDDREPGALRRFTDDPGLLPAFVVGWRTRGVVDPPAPLLVLDHQAGGHALTHHPILVGRVLPLGVNLDRLGRSGGRLHCALTLLDEAGALFPAVDGVTGTRGGPLGGALVALERLVREHLPDVPRLEDGVEAFVRLARSDLGWLDGWRCVTQGPLGLEEGPALDAPGREALATWGRSAGLDGPAGAWLVWLNCD